MNDQRKVLLIWFGWGLSSDPLFKARNYLLKRLPIDRSTPSFCRVKINLVYALGKQSSEPPTTDALGHLFHGGFSLIEG
jgi:hypothetical protein